MQLKLYQVDAFTEKLFSGNPAAVCPLDRWLSDHLMQSIAMENNLAETAFFVKSGDRYEIRWFTPTVEVDLCGHATLASAYILFTIEHQPGDTIRFFSPRSGELVVTKSDDLFTLNFPSDVFAKVPLTGQITDAFNYKPIEAYRGKSDYMLVFEKEEEIRNIEPDFAKVAAMKSRGVIVTAKGSDVDFVSRFFAPQSGINEDPVTGSAHTTLIPYWYERIGKEKLTARQLSPREGYLYCEYQGDRVLISGHARLYLRGEIDIT